MSTSHEYPERDRQTPQVDLHICADVQPLLIDYMDRELGESRSAFVREHLRMCPACQSAAEEIQGTLALFKGNAETADIPGALTEDRRQRLLWAVMHPFLDWVYRHHVAVSLAIMGLVLVIALIALQYGPLFLDTQRDQETVTPPVQIVPSDVPAEGAGRAETFSAEAPATMPADGSNVTVRQPQEATRASP